MLTLLVLAAGMGSRYGGLKQVDPVGPGGQILLEYSVYDALRAGFERVVFVIRKDLEAAFEEHISSRLRGQVPFSYAYQELDDLPQGLNPPSLRSKPWGTGHAIWASRQQIQGPFLSINADDYYGPEAYRLLAEHLKGQQPSYAMAGFRLENTLSEFGSVSRGLCRCSSEGWLEEVVEHTKIVAEAGLIRSLEQPQGPVTLEGSSLVSMNFWGLTPEIFPQLEQQLRDFIQADPGPKGELYIPSVLDRVIQQSQGRVKVLPSSESWFGVTYPEDKPKVVAQLAQRLAAGVYPEQLWT